MTKKIGRKTKQNQINKKDYGLPRVKINQIQDVVVCGQLPQLVGGGVIRVDPPYQRGQKYSVLQQQSVVESLVKGKPVIPPVHLAEHTDKDGNVYYTVIDGKQRTLSLTNFMENVFPFKSPEDELRYLDGLYFRDIQKQYPQTASDIMALQIKEIIYRGLNYDDEQSLFMQLNSSTVDISLDDLIKSYYETSYMGDTIKRIVTHESMAKLSSEHRRKATIMLLYSYTNNKKQLSRSGVVLKSYLRFITPEEIIKVEQEILKDLDLLIPLFVRCKTLQQLDVGQLGMRFFFKCWWLILQSKVDERLTVEVLVQLIDEYFETISLCHKELWPPENSELYDIFKNLKNNWNKDSVTTFYQNIIRLGEERRIL